MTAIPFDRAVLVDHDVASDRKRIRALGRRDCVQISRSRNIRSSAGDTATTGCDADRSTTELMAPFMKSNEPAATFLRASDALRDFGKRLRARCQIGDPEEGARIAGARGSGIAISLRIADRQRCRITRPRGGDLSPRKVADVSNQSRSRDVKSPSRSRQCARRRVRPTTAEVAALALAGEYAIDPRLQSLESEPNSMFVPIDT